MPIWGYLIFIHLLAICWGIEASIRPEAEGTLSLFSLVVGIAVVLACVADARKQRRPLVRSLQFIMLMTWPVAAAIYLACSRGWIGILWAMLWYVSVFSCLVLPAAAVEMMMGW